MALDAGYPHPDLWLGTLSSSQYSELLQYLEISKWHLSRQWRDDAISYLCWLLTTVNSKGKVDTDGFRPPTRKKQDKKNFMTREEMASVIRASLVSHPKSKAKKTPAAPAK